MRQKEVTLNSSLVKELVNKISDDSDLKIVGKDETTRDEPGFGQKDVTSTSLT